jgi:oleate hydratase
LPLVTWLRQQGVKIQFNTQVMNVAFDIEPERKVARRIEWIQIGQQGGIDLTEDDLVVVTNGSRVENSEWGDHHTPAKFDPIVHDGGSWHLCTRPEKSQWASASTTALDLRIPAYIERIAKRPAGQARW